MTCADVRPLIDAHLDRELDLRADLEVAEHLTGCGECARILEGRRELSRALHDANLHQAPSAALTRSIRAALEAEARPSRGFSWSLLWNFKALPAFATLAAAIVVAVLGISRLSAPRPDRELADEAVSGHIRSLLAGHLTDVASTDQHTVKPWFQGRLDFSPPVVDLTAAGSPLIGGRLDYMAGRPVAALVYRRNSHIVNLFEWPAQGSDPPRAEVRQGYNVVRWTEKGMTFRAVSDVNEGELGDFVARLRRAIP